MTAPINKMNEVWVSIRESKRMRHIVAISNLGNVMYGDGRVKNAPMYGHCKLAEGQIQFSHLIAKYFVPKTNEDVLQHRNCIDHITHNPIGMNVNDFRNLRWCTSKENSNFHEAKTNMIAGMTGVPKTDFGRLFLPLITGKVRGRNMNYYAWARNQFKKTGVVPSPEEYSHVYQGPKSEFAQWFNDKYGPGKQNMALYKRCYRHYRATGKFLED